jgi:HEAT repeat protein
MLPLLTAEGLALLLRAHAGAIASGEPEGRLLRSFHVLGLAAELARRGEDAGPLASEFAAAADPRVRRLAPVLAGGTPSGSALLLALAGDSDPGVREAAIRSIGDLGEGPLPESLAEAVLAALRDPYAAVRGAAMGALDRLGDRGGEEAVRILGTGAHRECGVDGAELLVPALRADPAALLAEPIPAHLAEDLCSGSGALAEDHVDLLRLLAPRARRLLGGLAPGLVDPATTLLETLAAAGETGAVREALQAADLGARVRAEAAAALGRRSAPEEWEPLVSSFLLDRAVEPGVRREFVAGHAGGFDRDDEDGKEAEAATAAWLRVLRAVASGAEDPALAGEAARALEALERR